MEISALSFPEMISIIATYHSYSVKDEPDYVARGYTEAQIQAIKEAKKRESVGLVTLNTFRFTRSVKDFPCSNFDYYSELFLPFNKYGVLPYPGTLTEQPNKIIEIFNLLKKLNAEAEEKARIKQEREAKGKKHG